jgi:hypothetical protein
MGPPSQIEPSAAIPIIPPGTEALIRSMVIAERVHDGERLGNPVCARWGDHDDGPASTSTSPLLPSSADAIPAPGRMTPTESADPLHLSTLMPPPALAPGDLVTPDAERLFYPVSTPPRHHQPSNPPDNYDSDTVCCAF